MKKTDTGFQIVKPRKKDDHFTIIPNILLQANNLNWFDRNVVGYLLSHKDGFMLNKQFVANGIGSCWKSVSRSFTRLEKIGVVTFQNKLLFINLDKIINRTDSPMNNGSMTLSPMTSSPVDLGQTVLPDETQIHSDPDLKSYNNMTNSPTNNTKQHEKQEEKKQNQQQDYPGSVLDFPPKGVSDDCKSEPQPNDPICDLKNIPNDEDKTSKLPDIPQVDISGSPQQNISPYLSDKELDKLNGFVDKAFRDIPNETTKRNIEVFKRVFSSIYRNKELFFNRIFDHNSNMWSDYAKQLQVLPISTIAYEVINNEKWDRKNPNKDTAHKGKWSLAYFLVKYSYNTSNDLWKEIKRQCEVDGEDDLLMFFNPDRKEKAN